MGKQTLANRKSEVKEGTKPFDLANIPLSIYFSFPVI